MSCTRLPLELIDAIFEHLHDDKRVLAACSLVCKAWIPSARRLLFADAILNQTRIEKLVESKPAAIPFVRRLCLQNLYGLKFWNENVPLLVGFKSVWSLSLRHMPWRTMNLDAKSMLLDQFASIIRLYFYEIKVAELSQLAQIICSFPHLKTLIIEGVMSQCDPGDLIPSAYRPPHSLRALELRNCESYRIFEWFLSFEIMVPLHTVYLHGTKSLSFHTLNKFLKALGPSLEVFLYDDNSKDSTGSWLISLDHNTHLCSLRIDLGQPSDIVKTTQILSQIVSSHMDEVCFKFFYHPDNDVIEEWDKVDRVLMQPPFSGLRKVEIVRFYHHRLGFGQKRPDLKGWAVTHLPRCSFRGILDAHEVTVPSLDFTYL